MKTRIFFLITVFTVAAFYGALTEIRVERELGVLDATIMKTVLGASQAVSKTLVSPNTSLLRDYHYEDGVSNEEDSVAVYFDPNNPDESLLFTTHKNGNVVKVWNLRTNQVLYTLTGFRVPNGIVVDQSEAAVYVSDRLNYAVKKFLISDIRALKFTPVASVVAGANWKSKEPMGLTLYRDSGITYVYVTYVGSTPKYVRAFNSTLSATTSQWAVPKGVALESIAADDENHRILVADESSNRVLVYSPVGTPENPTEFGAAVFASSSDPEGIDLYECGSDGYIIVSDQKTQPYTEYKIFDRKNFQYLAKFTINDGQDTDGITISQSALTNYPQGGIFVQSRDRFFEGVKWERMAAATGMSVCMSEGMPGGISTQDIAAPSIPLDLYASALSQTRVLVSFSPSEDNVGVAGYVIFRDGSRVGSSSEARFEDASLSPSTTYVYAVAAFDAAMNFSELSSSTRVTTLGEDTTPPVISNVGTRDTTYSSTTVYWETNEEADSYVEYGTTSAYGLVYASADYSLSHEAVLSSLSSNETYHYRVRSRDRSGNEAYSPEAIFSTAADVTAPYTLAQPEQGSYTNAVTVTLGNNEPANIYFTTDGLEPTINSPKYSLPLVFTTSTVLKFFAVDSYGNTETVQTKVYSVVLPSPSQVNKTLKTPSTTLLRDYHYEDGVSNEEDSAAVYNDPVNSDNSFLFTTHKSGNVVKAWSLKTNLVVYTLSGFNNPNGVAVDQDGGAVYVTDRNNYAVKKYLLSDIIVGNLTPTATFVSPADWKSREPMGVSVYNDGGLSEIFVTYVGSSNKYVRVLDSALLGSVREWIVPDASLESIAVDSANNLVYVADESANKIHVYTVFGNAATTSSFGQGVFIDDPEGIAIYECGSDGYIIISDQKTQPYTEYKIFDRKNFQYLAKFSVNDGRDTDGMTISQSALTNYPQGGFFAQSRDRFFEGVRWERIARATGMSVCGSN